MEARNGRRTEWDSFFGLRLDCAAQPEMRALAVAMWEARKASTPKLPQPGEWHLPFVEEDAMNLARHRCDDQEEMRRASTNAGFVQWYCGDLIRVSVARCARVSYESFETGRRSTVEEDLKLYERLVGSQPMHASPAEHQATPDEKETCFDNKCGDCLKAWWKHHDQWGNFREWRQYRKMLPGEAVAPLPEEFR